jgi:hypothetical protein
MTYVKSHEPHIGRCRLQRGTTSAVDPLFNVEGTVIRIAYDRAIFIMLALKTPPCLTVLCWERAMEDFTVAGKTGKDAWSL